MRQLSGRRGGSLLLELVDNGTSLVFLNETDNRVEKQKTADNTEINPVLETGSHCEHTSLVDSFLVTLDWSALFAARATPTPTPLVAREEAVRLPHDAGSRRVRDDIRRRIGRERRVTYGQQRPSERVMGQHK